MQGEPLPPLGREAVLAELEGQEGQLPADPLAEPAAVHPSGLAEPFRTVELGRTWELGLDLAVQAAAEAVAQPLGADGVRMKPARAASDSVQACQVR